VIIFTFMLKVFIYEFKFTYFWFNGFRSSKYPPVAQAHSHNFSHSTPHIYSSNSLMLHLRHGDVAAMGAKVETEVRIGVDGGDKRMRVDAVMRVT
jgi:hypothetical protein